MKRTITLFLVGSFLSGIATAQTNDTKEALYNVGFGSVFGGIGAVINKKKNEKFHKVFLKGMGQGALGGYLVFESKRLIGEFSKTGDYNYVWPSRILNSAGNSIMENAASNRNFWERWHLHIGFNRVEFLTQGRLRVRYRFMPLNFISFIGGYTQGRLDVSTTLKTGVFVFESSKVRIINHSGGGVMRGTAIGNSIILYNKNDSFFDKASILSHELIHVYQNESFVVFNSYLNRPVKSLIPKTIADSTLWKFIYLDLNTIYFTGAYGIDAKLKGNYYKRVFEQEARYYQKK